MTAEVVVVTAVEMEVEVGVAADEPSTPEAEAVVEAVVEDVASIPTTKTLVTALAEDAISTK